MPITTRNVFALTERQAQLVTHRCSDCGAAHLDDNGHVVIAAYDCHCVTPDPIDPFPPQPNHLHTRTS